MKNKFIANLVFYTVAFILMLLWIGSLGIIPGKVEISYPEGDIEICGINLPGGTVTKYAKFDSWLIK